MTRARRTQQPPLNQDHLEEEKEPAPAVRQHVASVLDDVQASRRRDIKTQTKTRIQAEA